jgi:hypothetical protein
VQPLDVVTTPFGVHLVQLDRCDPEIMGDLRVMRLSA